MIELSSVTEFAILLMTNIITMLITILVKLRT